MLHVSLMKLLVVPSKNQLVDLFTKALLPLNRSISYYPGWDC
jgi:hypothetical protein